MGWRRCSGLLFSSNKRLSTHPSRWAQVKNAAVGHSRACTALQADRRWMVTGTPINTDIHDLFGQFAVLRMAPFDNKVGCFFFGGGGSFPSSCDLLPPAAALVLLSPPLSPLLSPPYSPFTQPSALANIADRVVPAAYA